MKHFPIFLSVSDKRIVVVGGGDAAVAKLRLLLKTEARIFVYAETPAAEIAGWADAGRLTLLRREIAAGDVVGAALLYAAQEDALLDAHVAWLGREAGVLVNIVDNLDDSAFITPAIVDRDPVTVAIGTEGAAPVLARAIKADLEERLSPRLGLLARIGKGFRPLAERLPAGRKRREFWADYYFNAGPRAAEELGEEALPEALSDLLAKHRAAGQGVGHVDLVGAGPGDPELLTLKARKALDRADVVIHDRLAAPEILELARREALIIDAGKTGFGPSTPQEDINALMIEHARNGAHVVRLKAGDPGVFGRLDEELDALTEAGISWRIVPGITAASAAVAQIGQSLTKRGRNGAVRLLTGHDIKGFAEQDWRSLAREGEVAAIYMGKRSARFLQGRLMMHGADPLTQITVVENASRADSRVIATTLSDLPADIDGVDGPAVILLGLAPRAALQAANELVQSRELAL
ncbi:siroheme synthase CysG [Actibacterium sp. XHP0104]|uniref:siroheme synthase CysG n=1 Tax=Actibacterium sp. XHP0104 TaxID=2984335 RepID=UPI0021E77828|nr:siroheme synthase CysG [Actibacterium sp. XHP0104]MCV2882771.1 siroheme synthase CysG [Actibacterium sp. XHP0104]